MFLHLIKELIFKQYIQGIYKGCAASTASMDATPLKSLELTVFDYEKSEDAIFQYKKKLCYVVLLMKKNKSFTTSALEPNNPSTWNSQSSYSTLH